MPQGLANFGIGTLAGHPVYNKCRLCYEALRKVIDSIRHLIVSFQLPIASSDDTLYRSATYHNTTFRLPRRYPRKGCGMKILTAKAVEKLKSKVKRYEVRDARSSLRLIVFPSGAKSWIVRFRRPDGRSAKLTLGPVNTGDETDGAPVIGGPITLAGARKLAAEIDLERAAGKDPAAARASTKRRSDDAPLTFAAAAQAFVKEHASRKTRHWKVTARRLGLDPDGALRPKGIAQRWGGRPVGTIDGHDIYALIDEVRRRGVPGTRRLREGETDILARGMHATMSRFFSWLVSRREVDTNPCTGVAKPEPSLPRERVLSDDEIAALWAACDDGPFGAAVKVMLITGARRNEVSRMRRDELSADGVWTLPAERSKNRREHKVTLPPLARTIIATLPPTGDFVFSSNGRTPVAGWSVVKRGLDAHMPGAKQPWRLHDLRRTAVTGMARAGADLHVIERAINHTSGSFGGIVGVYQKYRYADEVHTALEAWANLLRTIVSPAPTNVVSIGRRG